MGNKEFLTWVYYRLVEVHGENPNFDYMHKLHKVIEDVEDLEKDLYSLKADYSQHLDQLRDRVVLLPAHAEIPNSGLLIESEVIESLKVAGVKYKIFE